MEILVKRYDGDSSLVFLTNFNIFGTNIRYNLYHGTW